MTRLLIGQGSMRLFNPLSLVRWNIHKPYLRDLEAGGVDIIPTIWLDQPGDYRIQSLYGGHVMAIKPKPADVNAARSILEALDTIPLYARVDMLRSPTGSLLLMELELIEPYLYPEQGPFLGDMLADAVVSRL